MLPIPILVYHRIGPSEIGLTTSLEDFEAHINWLAQIGASFLSCAEFESILEGRSTGRGRQVLITFDDGYREVHDLALPIMKRYRARGAAFIVTGCVRERKKSSDPCETAEHERYMSVEELQSIQQSGVLDVHSHTHRHRDWVNQTLQSNEALSTLREDLGRSRDFLSSTLKLPAAHFRHLAWPWGSCNSQLIGAARNVGFSYQYLVQFAAANRTNATDRLPRLCCDAMPIDVFQRRLEILMNGWTVPYVNALSRAYRKLRGRISSY